jgi:hypothetical protein
MPSLRRSTFCGEPLTRRQAHAWTLAAEPSTVDNAYGPTELTITCTGHRLPPHAASWPRPANGTVPIGDHPSLEGRLDDGELYVRGPQRFAGYLDPADNTGRFLTPDGTPHDPATPLTDAQVPHRGPRGHPGRPTRPDGPLPLSTSWVSTSAESTHSGGRCRS